MQLDLAGNKEREINSLFTQFQQSVIELHSASDRIAQYILHKLAINQHACVVSVRSFFHKGEHKIC